MLSVDPDDLHKKGRFHSVSSFLVFLFYLVLYLLCILRGEDFLGPPDPRVFETYLEAIPFQQLLCHETGLLEQWIEIDFPGSTQSFRFQSV